MNKKIDTSVKIIKYFFKKNSKQKIIGLILITGLLVSGYSLFAKKNNPETKKENKIVKEVTTLLINKEDDNQFILESIGSVEAETKIDVIALGNGTLSNIYFKIGDKVHLNQLLGKMQNNTFLTSLNNAQINLNNSQNNLLSVEHISNETISQTKISIEQAQIGVINAEKSIKAAELGLKTAKDNLSNAKNIREKENLDIKNNAIINFNGYLNAIFNACDQVAQLINISDQTPLDSSLGAKNPDSLRQTQVNYKKSLQKYNELLLLNPDIDSINFDMQKIVGGLSLSEKMLNSAIDLLDNTVSGSAYPESYIASQKTAFINLRNIIVSSETSAEKIVQGLNNAPLGYKLELDNLENAVRAAETQLEIAKNAKNTANLSLKNAQQGLSSAKAAKEQQIINAKTQVDNTRGQLNLSSVQTSNLIIKAPIKGIITRKYVDLGTEINPGQKIAEISQIDNLKIISNLSSEDIYKITIGQKVIIQDKYEAIITNINPAADPISKKVKIEIFFDNSDKLLLPGTFVKVSIPVESIKKTNPDSVFIPLRAINITQNEKFVFINEKNIARKKNIETGQTNGNLIEILTGLKNNDLLIIDGAKNLKNGDNITVVK